MDAAYAAIENTANVYLIQNCSRTSNEASVFHAVHHHHPSNFSAFPLKYTSIPIHSILALLHRGISNGPEQMAVASMVCTAS
jgi:hypothetical protein